MKNKLLILGLVFTGTAISAQVKVGDNHQTIDESAVFELESVNKGFLPPRLTTEQRDAITNPAEGLLVYNTDTKCLNYYNATEWLNTCGTVPDGEFGSITSTPSGYLVQGIAVNDPDETELLPYETLTIDVTQTGPYNFSASANGITFSASGEFTATGTQTIVLNANGSPSEPGTHTYSVGGYSFERTTYVPDRRYKDITEQGGVAARNHRFIYKAFTSDSGAVWLTTNLGSEYNKVGSSVFNPDAAPESTTDHLAYGSLFQWGRFSDGHELFSWTNGTEGTPVNGTVSVLSATDDPGHNNFITVSPQPRDWRSPQNDNLWQGESGINNPCPAGFRVPVSTEFQTEISTYELTNIESGFQSPFKFTSQGYRINTGTGALYPGDVRVWSSSVSGIQAVQFYITANLPADVEGHRRALGQSVRCIRN